MTDKGMPPTTDKSMMGKDQGMTKDGAMQGGQGTMEKKSLAMRGSRDRLAPLLLAAIVACLTVAAGAKADELPLGSAAPEIAGGPWINSTALTTAALRGKVALVEFWTYG